MLSLNKHDIAATIKDRYAIITYDFYFENGNINSNGGSDELRFEITIDCDAFISSFEANIDGEIFSGQTKEKEKADKEYKAAKKKNENAILISQPFDNIPNVFEIKTNIDSKSKVLLTITIEQYLKKRFNFNQLNVQILRNLSRYNIVCNYQHISFKLNITDLTGIYDVDIPSNVVIENKIIDKFKQNCIINGKITQNNNNCAANELILKYKIVGEQNDSMLLFDKESNTFCHIISDIVTDSMMNATDGTEGGSDDIEENILIARRVVIVIDRSGSMSGIKWKKTISATNASLKQLRSGYDRYCIILCGNQLEFVPTENIKAATNSNIKYSISYLEKQIATGCELINDALLKGIALIKKDIEELNENINADNYYMNQIIFITDGNPTIGETNTDKITLNVSVANDLRKIDKYSSKISIFSFGIGRDGNDSQWVSDLNHLFLRKLSLNNHGFYKRIKQTSADTLFADYFTILSKPVLSNIEIKYHNKNITQLTGTTFNALYAGNDLIICGRIENIENSENKMTLNATISAITGKEVSKNKGVTTKPIHIRKELEVNIDLDDMKEAEKNNNNIERIWAYLKLKQFAENKLMTNDMIEVDEDEKKENDKVPLNLAMKYKFVTPWTSMIVVKKKKEIFEEKDDEYGEMSAEMEEHKIKLVTIGDSNCGKTSLILRFVENIFEKKRDEVTMNLNCKNKKLKINDDYFTVALWDTAGQEKYSSTLAPMYLRNANGIIFVCDINNMESIDNVRKWANSINQTIEFNKNNSILIVNKSDLSDGDDETAIHKIKELTNKLGINYVVTSAKNNVNVKSTFFKLIGSIYDTMFENKVANMRNKNNNNNNIPTYGMAASGYSAAGYSSYHSHSRSTHTSRMCVALDEGSYLSNNRDKRSGGCC